MMNSKLSKSIHLGEGHSDRKPGYIMILAGSSLWIYRIDVK